MDEGCNTSVDSLSLSLHIFPIALSFPGSALCAFTGIDAQETPETYHLNNGEKHLGILVLWHFTWMPEYFHKWCHTEAYLCMNSNVDAASSWYSRLSTYKEANSTERPAVNVLWSEGLHTRTFPSTDNIHLSAFKTESPGIIQCYLTVKSGSFNIIIIEWI